ncbi:MAG: VacJ family lipoprotein [Candidatus Electrothrix sp. AR4]|nr:VacJ family lipoprotein [Candidatus Electrothrix sp. AR4]
MRIKNVFCMLLISVILIIFSLSPPFCGVLHAADDEIDFLDDAFYDEIPDENAVRDPFEGINRAMFTFNDYTYTWVMNPVATWYSHLLPHDIRGAIADFFYNLQEPVRIVNAVLQARFSDAGTLLARFAINSTGGVGGLGDPASMMGFLPVQASFCQTLDAWGVGDGIYLVVPIMGPTTLRDLSGKIVEGVSMTPYYFWAAGWEESSSIYIGKELNNASLHLGEYEKMKKLSFDPYAGIRDGYFQHRKQVFRDALAP